jgi:hypothetical protein
MKLVPLTIIVLLAAGISAQPASAGPFDALKNFFVRPQPQQHHVVHPRVHRDAKEGPKDGKDGKEAPTDSPNSVVPPNEQQTNSAATQNAPTQNAPTQNVPTQNTSNTLNAPNTQTVVNRPGRPAAIASAPLF